MASAIGASLQASCWGRISPLCGCRADGRFGYDSLKVSTCGGLLSSTLFFFKLRSWEY